MNIGDMIRSTTSGSNYGRGDGGRYDINITQTPSFVDSMNAVRALQQARGLTGTIGPQQSQQKYYPKEEASDREAHLARRNDKKNTRKATWYEQMLGGLRQMTGSMMEGTGNALEDMGLSWLVGKSDNPNTIINEAKSNNPLQDIARAAVNLPLGMPAAILRIPTSMHEAATGSDLETVDLMNKTINKEEMTGIERAGSLGTSAVDAVSAIPAYGVLGKILAPVTKPLLRSFGNKFGKVGIQKGVKKLTDNQVTKKAQDAGLRAGEAAAASGASVKGVHSAVQSGAKEVLDSLMKKEHLGKSAVLGALAEGTEEFAQTFTENARNYGHLAGGHVDEEGNVDIGGVLGEAGYAALIGGVLGGVVDPSIQAARNKNLETRTTKFLKREKVGTKDKISKSIADTLVKDQSSVDSLADADFKRKGTPFKINDSAVSNVPAWNEVHPEISEYEKSKISSITKRAMGDGTSMMIEAGSPEQRIDQMTMSREDVADDIGVDGSWGSQVVAYFESLGRDRDVARQAVSLLAETILNPSDTTTQQQVDAAVDAYNKALDDAEVVDMFAFFPQSVREVSGQAFPQIKKFEIGKSDQGTIGVHSAIAEAMAADMDGDRISRWTSKNPSKTAQKDMQFITDSLGGNRGNDPFGVYSHLDMTVTEAKTIGSQAIADAHLLTSIGGFRTNHGIVLSEAFDVAERNLAAAIKKHEGKGGDFTIEANEIFTSEWLVALNEDLSAFSDLTPATVSKIKSRVVSSMHKSLGLGDFLKSKIRNTAALNAAPVDSTNVEELKTVSRMQKYAPAFIEWMKAHGIDPLAPMIRSHAHVTYNAKANKYIVENADGSMTIVPADHLEGDTAALALFMSDLSVTGDEMIETVGFLYRTTVLNRMLDNKALAPNRAPHELFEVGYDVFAKEFIAAMKSVKVQMADLLSKEDSFRNKVDAEALMPPDKFGIEDTDIIAKWFTTLFGGNYTIGEVTSNEKYKSNTILIGDYINNLAEKESDGGGYLNVLGQVDTKESEGFARLIGTAVSIAKNEGARISKATWNNIANIAKIQTPGTHVNSSNMDVFFVKFDLLRKLLMKTTVSDLGIGSPHAMLEAFPELFHAKDANQLASAFIAVKTYHATLRFADARSRGDQAAIDVERNRLSEGNLLFSSLFREGDDVFDMLVDPSIPYSTKEALAQTLAGTKESGTEVLYLVQKPPLPGTTVDPMATVSLEAEVNLATKEIRQSLPVAQSIKEKSTSRDLEAYRFDANFERGDLGHAAKTFLEIDPVGDNNIIAEAIVSEYFGDQAGSEKGKSPKPIDVLGSASYAASPDVNPVLFTELINDNSTVSRDELSPGILRKMIQGVILHGHEYKITGVSTGAGFDPIVGYSKMSREAFFGLDDNKAPSDTQVEEWLYSHPSLADLVFSTSFVTSAESSSASLTRGGRSFANLVNYTKDKLDQGMAWKLHKDIARSMIVGTESFHTSIALSLKSIGGSRQQIASEASKLIDDYIDAYMREAKDNFNQSVESLENKYYGENLISAVEKMENVVVQMASELNRVLPDGRYVKELIRKLRVNSLQNNFPEDMIPEDTLRETIFESSTVALRTEYRKNIDGFLQSFRFLSYAARQAGVALNMSRLPVAFVNELKGTVIPPEVVVEMKEKAEALWNQTTQKMREAPVGEQTGDSQSPMGQLNALVASAIKEPEVSKKYSGIVGTLGTGVTLENIQSFDTLSDIVSDYVSAINAKGLQAHLTHGMTSANTVGLAIMEATVSQDVLVREDFGSKKVGNRYETKDEVRARVEAKIDSIVETVGEMTLNSKESGNTEYKLKLYFDETPVDEGGPTEYQRQIALSELVSYWQRKYLKSTAASAARRKDIDFGMVEVARKHAADSAQHVSNIIQKFKGKRTQMSSPEGAPSKKIPSPNYTESNALLARNVAYYMRGVVTGPTVGYSGTYTNRAGAISYLKQNQHCGEPGVVVDPQDIIAYITDRDPAATSDPGSHVWKYIESEFFCVDGDMVNMMTISQLVDELVKPGGMTKYQKIEAFPHDQCIDDRCCGLHQGYDMATSSDKGRNQFNSGMIESQHLSMEKFSLQNSKQNKIPYSDQLVYEHPGFSQYQSTQTASSQLKSVNSLLLGGQIPTVNDLKVVLSSLKYNKYMESKRYCVAKGADLADSEIAALSNSSFIGFRLTRPDQDDPRPTWVRLSDINTMKDGELHGYEIMTAPATDVANATADAVLNSMRSRDIDWSKTPDDPETVFSDELQDAHEKLAMQEVPLDDMVFGKTTAKKSSGRSILTNTQFNKGEKIRPAKKALSSISFNTEIPVDPKAIEVMNRIKGRFKPVTSVDYDYQLVGGSFATTPQGTLKLDESLRQDLINLANGAGDMSSVQQEGPSKVFVIDGAHILEYVDGRPEVDQTFKILSNKLNKQEEKYRTVFISTESLTEYENSELAVYLSTRYDKASHVDSPGPGMGSGWIIDTYLEQSIKLNHQSMSGGIKVERGDIRKRLHRWVIVPKRYEKKYGLSDGGASVGPNAFNKRLLIDDDKVIDKERYLKTARSKSLYDGVELSSKMAMQSMLSEVVDAGGQVTIEAIKKSGRFDLQGIEIKRTRYDIDTDQSQGTEDKAVKRREKALVAYLQNLKDNPDAMSAEGVADQDLVALDHTVICLFNVGDTFTPLWYDTKSLGSAPPAKILPNADWFVEGADSISDEISFHYTYESSIGDQSGKFFLNSGNKGIISMLNRMVEDLVVGGLMGPAESNVVGLMAERTAWSRGIDTSEQTYLTSLIYELRNKNFNVLHYLASQGLLHPEFLKDSTMQYLSTDLSYINSWKVLRARMGGKIQFFTDESIDMGNNREINDLLNIIVDNCLDDGVRISPASVLSTAYVQDVPLVNSINTGDKWMRVQESASMVEPMANNMKTDEVFKVLNFFNKSVVIDGRFNEYSWASEPGGNRTGKNMKFVPYGTVGIDPAEMDNYFADTKGRVFVTFDPAIGPERAYAPLGDWKYDTTRADIGSVSEESNPGYQMFIINSIGSGDGPVNETMDKHLFHALSKTRGKEITDGPMPVYHFSNRTSSTTLDVDAVEAKDDMMRPTNKKDRIRIQVMHAIGKSLNKYLRYTDRNGNPIPLDDPEYIRFQELKEQFLERWGGRMNGWDDWAVETLIKFRRGWTPDRSQGFDIMNMNIYHATAALQDLMDDAENGQFLLRADPNLNRIPIVYMPPKLSFLLTHTNYNNSNGSYHTEQQLVDEVIEAAEQADVLLKDRWATNPSQAKALALFNHYAFESWWKDVDGVVDNNPLFYGDDFFFEIDQSHREVLETLYITRGMSDSEKAIEHELAEKNRKLLFWMSKHADRKKASILAKKKGGGKMKGSGTTLESFDKIDKVLKTLLDFLVLNKFASAMLGPMNAIQKIFQGGLLESQFAIEKAVGAANTRLKVDKEALKAVIEEPGNRKFLEAFLASSRIGLRGDFIAHISTEGQNVETWNEHMDGGANQSIWRKSLGKVASAARWMISGFGDWKWQDKQFMDLLVSNLGAAHPGLTSEGLNSMLKSDPPTAMQRLIMYDATAVSGAFNRSHFSDDGQVSLMAIFVQEALKNPKMNFAMSSVFTPFINFQIALLNRAGSQLLPFTTLGRLARDFVAGSDMFSENIRAEAEMGKTSQSIGHALVQDALVLGRTSLFVAVLMAVLEPPDDEDKKNNLDEWKIGGKPLNLPWPVHDMLAPWLYTAIALKEGSMDIFMYNVKNMLSGNPVIKANTIVNVFLETTDAKIEEGIDLYDNPDGYWKGGEPTPLDEFRADTSSFLLEWVTQFAAPAILKEALQLGGIGAGDDMEKSAARIYTTDQNGLMIDEDTGMYMTERTTYGDYRMRRLTKKHPFLAWIMNKKNGVDSGTSGKTGYFASQMPNNVIFQQNQLDSMNALTINEDDPEEQKLAVYYTVIDLLRSTDDMETLTQNNIVIPYKTKQYVGDVLMSKMNTLDAEWDDFQIRLNGNWDSIGGYDNFLEIKKAYKTSKDFYANLFYDKLKSEELLDFARPWNRFKTSYAQDINGEWYATGIIPSPATPFPQGNRDTEEGAWDIQTRDPVSGELLGSRALVDAYNKNKPLDVEGSAKLIDDFGYLNQLAALSSDDNGSGGSGGWVGYGGGYSKYRRGGGGGSGSGGFTPNIYSNSARLNFDRPDVMRSGRPYDPRYDYLRPSVETKGSRESYNRKDI